MINFLLAKLVYLAGKGFETRAQMINAALNLNVPYPLIFNYIGEGGTNSDVALRHYLGLISAISGSTLLKNSECAISLKPSQFGQGNMRSLALKEIGNAAHISDIGVWVDAENYRLSYEHLTAAKRLKEENLRTGLCIQLADTRNYVALTEICMEEGIRIRVCKGAYKDYLGDYKAAYPSNEELLKRLLEVIMTCEYKDNKHMLEIATMRDRTWAAVAEQHQLTLQLLYGWHKNLKATHMKIYMPYGRHWWPYIRRRLSGK